MKRRNFILTAACACASTLLPNRVKAESNSNIIYANYIPILVTPEFKEFVEFFKSYNGFELNYKQRVLAYSYFFPGDVGVFYPIPERQCGYTTFISTLASFEAKRGKHICLIIDYIIGGNRRWIDYKDGCLYTINSVEYIRGHTFDKILIDTNEPLTEIECNIIIPAISRKSHELFNYNFQKHI